MVKVLASLTRIRASRNDSVWKLLVIVLPALAVLFWLLLTVHGQLGWMRTPVVDCKGATTTTPPCETDVVYRGPAGIPALRTRADLGPLM
jgi:hypothetical protein